MKELYESPQILMLELYSEGILCSSGTEDNEYIDGEW